MSTYLKFSKVTEMTNLDTLIEGLKVVKMDYNLIKDGVNIKANKNGMYSDFGQVTKTTDGKLEINIHTHFQEQEVIVAGKSFKLDGNREEDIKTYETLVAAIYEVGNTVIACRAAGYNVEEISIGDMESTANTVSNF